MASQSLTKGANVLQKYDYGYGQIDGSGNLDTTKNNGQLARVESYIGTNKQWTQKFNYDSIGRLTESKEYRSDTSALSYKQKFDFDRFGNMYRKAANNPTTGQQNPLPYTPIEDADISKSTNRFTSDTTYDEAGNVINDAKFRSMTFAYDANGRMAKSEGLARGEALSVYDAAGIRVAEKVNDIWRNLVYDIGGKLIAEYGGAEQTGVGGVNYVMQDWQGSTRAVVNAHGFVRSRNDYTAFGEDIQSGTGLRTENQGFGLNTSVRQKYGLTERDDATGLDHTWFRKHETQAGRWTSPDPYNGSMNIGDPQSFNRYSYVQNDPTNYIDPSGLNASAASFFCYDIVTWGHFPDDPYNTYINTTTVCGFSGSGAMTGGGNSYDHGGGWYGGGLVADKLPFNNCTQFVDYLLALSSKITSAHRKDGWSRVGKEMMDLAYKGYSRHINNGFAGFQERLIGSSDDSGRQGAGVYGHILMFAGAYIAGKPVMHTAGLLIDGVQWVLDRPQSKEELAGTEAGRKIGKLMWENDSATPNDREQLKANLTEALCE